MGKQFADVHSSRGAPMGRLHFCIPGWEAVVDRCYLFRVNMVDGDYDDGGAYWGGPPSLPLYCVRNNKRDAAGIYVQLFYRAATRDAAKRMALADHRSLVFFR